MVAKNGPNCNRVRFAMIWNSFNYEPTDAGALGTEKCVLFARVMELVDVPDSKSGGVTRAGSSPALGTKNLF